MEEAWFLKNKELQFKLDENFILKEWRKFKSICNLIMSMKGYFCVLQLRYVVIVGIGKKFCNITQTILWSFRIGNKGMNCLIENLCYKIQEYIFTLHLNYEADAKLVKLQKKKKEGYLIASCFWIFLVLANF